jgi:hypothetical protein
MNWTPILEWYMVRFVAKNGHQNTCHDEIGPCVLDVHRHKSRRGMFSLNLQRKRIWVKFSLGVHVAIASLGL